MPAINGANREFFLTMRQKYMNGSGHTLQGESGLLTTGGAWPLMTNSPGWSVTGNLGASALAGEQEITLGSASEAAPFRPGTTITLFDATDNTTTESIVVLSSKNQKLILAAGLANAYDQGSIVAVPFGVGPDGISTSMDVTAGGWTPTGAGDVATLVDLYQRVCTNPAAFAITTAAAPLFTLDIGSTANVNTLVGDTVTFVGDVTAGLAGVTARISSNTAGANVVIGLEQIIAVNAAGETVTSPLFPIVVDGVSLTPSAAGAGDTLTIACTFIQEKINAVAVPNNVDAAGNSTSDPLTGASQEGLGDQGPVMVAACLGVIDQLGGTARLSLTQEEKLMGSFGAIGKRLLLAQDEAIAATTITLEWNEAAGDVPFPLAGIIEILDAETGVDSTAFAQPLLVHTSTFTRARGSRTLTLAAAIPAGGVTVGQIVQLAPGQSGPIFLPYASAIDSKDMAQLLTLTELAVTAHTNPVV